MRDVKMAIVGGLLVIAGVAIGATLFGTERAEAQRGPYRTCVFGHQETHDIDGNGEWERADRNFAGDRIIRIPSGWEVVSGGGALNSQRGRLGMILLCRR